MSQKPRTRAHYIHRLSYSAQERIVGAFVLIAVGILVWLLISSQKTRELFEDEFILYGTMNSIQAVDEGTNVVISGLNVGSVSEISIDEHNHVVVSMQILKKYQKLIRSDSTAELLDFKFAMLGKSVIEISVGSPDRPVIEEGSKIEIRKSLNLTDLAARVEPVLMSLEESIQRVNEILQLIEPEQIKSNIENLSGITGNLKDISAQIARGRGSAGAVLYNENLQQDLLQSSANLRKITEQTMALLQEIQQQMKTLGPVSKKIEPLMDKTNKAIEQASEVSEEADKTIKATQQIWPLSGKIPATDREVLLAPEAVE